MANRGAPTVADEWALEIKTSAGITSEKDDLRLMIMSLPIVLEGKFKVNPSQMLYEQTKVPIPTGAKPKGILGFLVVSPRFDRRSLDSKGTKYKLICRNVSGDTIETSITRGGQFTKELPVIPGFPMERIIPQTPPGTKP